MKSVLTNKDVRSKRQSFRAIGDSYPLVSSVSGLREIEGNVLEGSLQLNNVADGFGDEKRFEFFCDGGIIGLMKLSELVGDSGPDDERKGSFEKESNTHLCQDIGPCSINNSWPFEDFLFHSYQVQKMLMKVLLCYPVVRRIICIGFRL